MPNPALRNGLILLGFAAVAASTTSAISQEAGFAAARAEGRDFQGRRSVSGYSTTHALTGEWQVVDVYALPDRNVLLPDGRPWIEYVARRASGPDRSSITISWTSSRDCPALKNTLIWMSTLVAPRIEIPGIAPNEAEPAGRRPIAIYADGLATTVWGRGSQPDHTVDTIVEISSNGGLIAAFGQAATENLASCWRNAQPELP